MRVRIDFDKDPAVAGKDAKQVVWIEDIFEQTDPQNLVGKRITSIELEHTYNCLVLTVEEDEIEIEIEIEDEDKTK